MPQDDAKYGTTLVARDTAANRKLFPNGPFGALPVAASVCDGDQCPHYHFTEDATHDGALETPIHILVASFRDRLCGRTLHNAFTHAENPKRLFIRVIDQTESHSDKVDDAGCWETYCEEYNPNCSEYKDQVQMVKVDASESKGPTYARSKLSAMIHWDFVHAEEPNELELQPVHNEDFCMQIDSHMDFSDNFDTGLVAMFHRTENDYAVLSTYVADIEQNNKDPKTVPSLCMVQFTSSIRNWATKECRKLIRPKLTNAMWGAGLSFHRCHAEVNVPVDPYLDNVFDGEEGSRGIRFFTHGYDVYTPDKVLVTHDYHTHQGNPVVHTWGRGHKHMKNGDEEEEAQTATHWKWNQDIEHARDQWRTFGSKRVNMLLGLGSTFDATEKERTEVERIRRSRFGLGDKRNLEHQVRDFTGLNLLEERMEVNRCGNLIWVPFEESPEYGVPQILSRAYDGGVVAKLGTPVPAAAVPQQQQGLRAAANVVVPPPVQPGKVVPQLPAAAAEVQDAHHDYRLAGGILLVVLVLARLVTHKKNKDERKKS